MSKCTRFSGGIIGPKICARRTKTDFKDWVEVYLSFKRPNRPLCGSCLLFCVHLHMFQIIMHPQATVKDVGDDSQDEEDEVFHRENDVEVFYTSHCQKSSLPPVSSTTSSSQLCSMVQGECGPDKASLPNSSRSKSKAVIEVDDGEDDPIESLAGTCSQNLDTTCSQNLDTDFLCSGSATFPSASTITEPACWDPVGTVVSSKIDVQDCSKSVSNLSISAKEFQPRSAPLVSSNYDNPAEGNLPALPGCTSSLYPLHQDLPVLHTAGRPQYPMQVS